MTDKGQQVAIITGASQGIGASLVSAYPRRGLERGATARTMKPTEDPDALPVDGDLADPATAGRIVSGAIGRFGRIDTLINNVGVYISKPHPGAESVFMTSPLQRASSMVILYAARHRLPVPGLARWLLALGILATLAANVAHGWLDGPVGAVVAAWPAASLVGSYELLLWLIRTSTASALAHE